MKTRVGVGPNQLAHDEGSVAENKQTKETENERRQESITQVTYSIKSGRPPDINRTRQSRFPVLMKNN